MSEYAEEIVALRFDWCVPDRTGVWAFAGVDVEAPDTDGVVKISVTNPFDHRPGWWSFLTVLPEVEQ